MIRAIIVEDEKKSRELLREMVEKHTPEINLVGIADGVASGVELIKKNNPDLVFLDISMPDGSGFDLLQLVSDKKFDVIFATAHEKYAVKAIKFSALDYLLKPLDVDELQLAVNRFLEKRKKAMDNKSLIENFIRNLKTEKKSEYRLALNTTEGTYFLKTDEIIRCEADSNYTKFFLYKRKNMIASKAMTPITRPIKANNRIRIILRITRVASSPIWITIVDKSSGPLARVQVLPQTISDEIKGEYG